MVWEDVGDSWSGCVGWMCWKGGFLGVILEGKGKGMDRGWIWLGEEEGLMVGKGVDLGKRLDWGWGEVVRKSKLNGG